MKDSVLKIFLFIPILYVFFLNSCLTTVMTVNKDLKLNQTAEVIKMNNAETSFSLGTDIQQGIAYNQLNSIYMNPNEYGYVIQYPFPDFSYGVYQRIGINNLLEFQFRYEETIVLTYILIFNKPNDLMLIPFPVWIYNLDFGFKYKLYDKNRYKLAISPYFGISPGFFGVSFGETGIYPTTGFRLIGSYDMKKNPDMSVYYGLTFALTDNLLQNIFNDEFFPLIDIETGISLGFENRKDKMQRYEIGISSLIDFNYFFDRGRPSRNEPYFSGYSISLYFSYSIGGQYGM